MEVTVELSGPVVMQQKHTMFHNFLKILVTGLHVARTLIEYSSNSLEENDEEEKEPIDIESTEQKDDPEIMKMLLNLDDQMHKKKTRKYCFA